MVDLFLEYGYYIVGIGVAIFGAIVSYFSIKRYFHDMKLEQKNAIREDINAMGKEVLKAIKDSDDVMNQKFVATDQAISNNITATTEIKHDVEVLENDFKSICQKIGKHEYIVDKVLPQYLNLQNSITDFKSVLLSNKDNEAKNTETE